ncbi:MAG: hypothetical protein ACYCXT_04540 [Acidiferrobacteraceae bacterium]
MLDPTHDTKHIRVATRIASILRASNNPSLSFYQNEALTGQIAIAMARHITAMGATEAEYLDDMVDHDSERRQRIRELLTGNEALLYGHQMERFHQVRPPSPEAAQYTPVKDLSAIFHGEKGAGYSIIGLTVVMKNVFACLRMHNGI